MFSLVDAPTALPGACYLCSSGTKSPFIDWGVSIEFYGALYTCSECTASVASLLGMVTPEKFAKLLSDLDQLHASNVDLQLKNYELVKIVNAMQIVGIDEPVPNSNGLPSDSFADPILDLLADDSSIGETPREADELVDNGAGTVDESSNDERVDKLRSDEPKPKHKYTI